MKLSRDIERALGAPEYSLFDPVMRLKGMGYDALKIMEMARESKLYAELHGFSVVLVFSMYVSALSIPKPQPPAGHAPAVPSADAP